MEDGSPDFTGPSKSDNEPEESSKKDKKSKSKAKKSRKSNPKTSSDEPSKKTKKNKGKRTTTDGQRPEASGQATSSTATGINDDSNLQHQAELAASLDEPSPKSEHSKSRSRSGSRSRFSGFFKRKKRSKSETDLNQQVTDDIQKPHESAEDVKRRKRPESLPLKAADDSRYDSSTPRALRANLKRTSPHHAYDSRIQPRDRLKNMTVRDAVKQQQLRRVHSSSRSPHRQRVDFRDNRSPSYPRGSESSFQDSPGVSRPGENPLDFHDSDRSATIPRARRSSRPVESENWNSQRYVSEPEFLNSVIPGEYESDSRAHDPDKDNQPRAISVDREVQNQDRDGISTDVSTHASSTPTPDMDVDAGKAEQQKEQNQDTMNDGEDTKTLVNVSMFSQDEEPPQQARRSPSPMAKRDSDDLETKMKRKASLSQFLELRQTLPSAQSRDRRISQSSDSGVTSRDASPSGSTVNRATRKRQRQEPQQGVQNSAHGRKTSNPYVLSSVPIPAQEITAPRLSVNDKEISEEVKNLSAAAKQMSIFIEDTAGESSSVSSSPQVQSMTSSFRSTDQGYAEDGSAESSDNDENSAFSTPPEEVESSGKTRKVRPGRFITSEVLEKLLGTSKDRDKAVGKFPEIDIEEPDTENKRFEDIDKEGVNLTGEASTDKNKLSVGQKYIPRGVRRSKSDVEGRPKSPRRVFRQAPSLSDGMSDSKTGQSVSIEVYTASPDEDRLSANSTSTLTNLDGGTAHNSEFPERLDQKMVPVMGTVAQQKYRRTFSPSRVRKFVPKPDIEKPEVVTSVIHSPTETPPTGASPLSLALISPVSDIPTQETIPIVQPSTSSTEGHPIIILTEQDSPSAPSTPLLSPKTFPEKSDASLSTPLKGILKSPSAESFNRADTKNEIIPSLSKGEKVHSGSDNNYPITSPIKGQIDTLDDNSATQSSGFPLIHGLEVGMFKVPSFSGYSLTDYLQEQSAANWRRQMANVKTDKVIKEGQASKKSFKRKGISKEDSKTKADFKEGKIRKKDDSKRVELEQESIEETDQQVRYVTIDNTLKMMVDKGCQTSSWLLDSIGKKKSTKIKKKSHSFTKKLKRRGSAVSDTFIPSESQKYKEAYQRSSLGDLRAASATGTDFKKGATAKSSPWASLLGKRSPEKKVFERKSNRKFAELGGDLIRSEPLRAGASGHVHDIDKRSIGSGEGQKTKKLSLTAIILLKNRLARFKEKKKKEKTLTFDHEEELVESEVPSDTFITIENELNLSKLEVSKETDIIDDDIFEPEFSLDYSKKHISFEPLPHSEPMQSEEPLPPLLPSSTRRMRQRRESTMRERRRKCVQYCKKFVAFLFSHIGLCSLVVAYTVMGGVIFQALEDQAEYSVRSEIRDKREMTVNTLISLAVDFERTERGMENLTEKVNSTVLDYQEFVHTVTKDKGWDGVEGPDEEGLWTFASSLLFAITVTTTIGYGHVAPKTPEGRIVTIGYAVVGIPLTLLCLTNIGDVMATGFRLLYGKVCCGICCTMFKPRRRKFPTDLEKGLGRPLVTTEEEQADKPKEVIHVPTSLCLLLIAAYIFAGAMLFASWEGWDILTGSYFCFITLSTIGFGDIVPGMDSNNWAHEEKLVLCALYLVLGLSLIAMCFNLVQEDVKAKCRWLGMKLGIVEKPETPI